jgi:CubicO group peptidase (beta-lactamase class C family)
MSAQKDRPGYRLRRVRDLSAALILLLSVAGPVAADDLAEVADPAQLGLSAAGLAKIAPSYQARFDSFQADIVPGAVVAVARGGKLAYLQPIGFQDRAKTVPMKPDSIFWIASMSKPVTSVAAMILVDDGKLELDAPVAKYLPEIANMRVVSATSTPATMADQLEPQKRPMTVRDLLRHTSGIAYPEMDFAFPADGGADADQKARVWHLHLRYVWLDWTTWRRDNTIANFVSALSQLPLAHQPGEAHEYGWSADVLGRVIEVASGQPFDQFLQDRLFAPLHMVDTGFNLPKEKLDRLVDSPMPKRPPVWDFTKPAKLFSGGGGLVSTAADYLRFCQMLLNGGELDGVRVLSAQSVTAMTTNALPPGTPIFGGDEVGTRAGTTFGLGFAITTNPVGSWMGKTPGSFGWAGSWGTYFWIDPTEKLIGIQMVQATPSSKARASMRSAGILRLIYGALSPEHAEK